MVTPTYVCWFIMAETEVCFISNTLEWVYMGDFRLQGGAARRLGICKILFLVSTQAHSMIGSQFRW